MKKIFAFFLALMTVVGTTAVVNAASDDYTKLAEYKIAKSPDMYFTYDFDLTDIYENNKEEEWWSRESEWVSRNMAGAQISLEYKDGTVSVLNFPSTYSRIQGTAVLYDFQSRGYSAVVRDLGHYSAEVILFYEDPDDENVLIPFGKPIEFTANGKSAEVVFGDINGDGGVNVLDRIYFTRYIAGWNNYAAINSAAADLNSDGVVNMLDRIILTRHLARWSGYETLPIRSNS